tara:strand:- start:1240 stop:2346 length:1107 start_codon:yes stop_codon:yes gene_type:complete
MNYYKSKADKALKQIEEAYEAVAGVPPGKAAHKQQLKPDKPIKRTWERAGKKVKVKGGNTDIPAEKPDGYQGFAHDNSGPNGADNWKSTELDPDNPKMKLDNTYDVKQLSDTDASDYFKAENDKINKESINTNMAKNKRSIFDRLYEEVMDDEQVDAVELGIDDVEDVDVEETDTITITIPKDVAHHLHDALMDVMDAVDDIEDVEDELGDSDDWDDDEDAEDEDAETARQKTYGGDKGDDPRRYNRRTHRKSKVKDYGEGEEEEENFNYFGEEIEAEVLGTPLVNQKKGDPTPVTGNANVVHTQYTSKVGSSEGNGKIDATLDPDGTDEGTPLVNQKKGNPTSVKGKSNVVKSKIKGGNQEFFQKNN